MKSKLKVVIQATGELEEMTVPFTEQELAELQEVAQNLGTTPAMLIETIVLEQVEKIKQSRA